jgi:hypothetical protein
MKLIYPSDRITTESGTRLPSRIEISGEQLIALGGATNDKGWPVIANVSESLLGMAGAEAREYDVVKAGTRARQIKHVILIARATKFRSGRVRDTIGIDRYWSKVRS